MHISEYLDVKTSDIHGTGVFARKLIPANTVLIEYIGEKITKAESKRRQQESMQHHHQNRHHAGTYIFEYDDEYDIDGDIPENYAKYVNHSCDPNCESDIVDDKIIIYAIRDILEGEELFFNYGFEFNDEIFEMPCYCGSPRCVGYMVGEDYWPQLQEVLTKCRSWTEYTDIHYSTIHNKGVFAKQLIPQGTVIGEYFGEKISKEEGTRRAEAQVAKAKLNPLEGKHYIFELDDEYDVDGNTPGNYAKYVNHSCNPNCSYEIRDGHIYYVATRDIQKGEELFFNYGFELDDPSDLDDLRCYCGDPNCVGYMIDSEEIPKLKEMLAKRDEERKAAHHKS